MVEFCKLAETFEADAYEDPLSADGLPITAGFGSTINRDGHCFRLGDRVTENEAEYLIQRDVRAKYEELVNIPYWDSLLPGQQAALTDLDYNEGYGYKDGDHDSLDKLMSDAAKEMNQALKGRHWDKVGEILQKYDNKDQLGLSRRRYGEWLLWRGATPQNAYEKAWGMTSVAQINKAVLG